MPFMYELKIAAGEPSYTFVQQLISVGSVAEAGQAVCTVTDGAGEFHVPAPRRGLVVEWFVEHGAVIENLDSLARIVCEGAEVSVPAVAPMRLG